MSDLINSRTGPVLICLQLFSGSRTKLESLQSVFDFRRNLFATNLNYFVCEGILNIYVTSHE